MTQVPCFLAGLTSGNFADNYGRKKTIMIMSILTIISTFGMVFAVNWWIFFIFILMQNFWNHIGYMAVSVYSLEILGPSKREWSTMVSTAYAFGYLLSSPAAYAFPYWRVLTSVISAAYILFLPMIYFCPASPKWLHIKGKSSKVEKVIRVFAKKTKVQIDDSLLENLEYESASEVEGSSSVLELMRDGLMRKLSLLVSLSFFASALVFYGLSLGSATLPGNIYVNNAINSAIDISSCLLRTVFCFISINRV